ncbi:hypothetical protein TMatcc_008700 [Talaromyces marneffei ATCC 18224]
MSDISMPSPDGTQRDEEKVMQNSVSGSPALDTALPPEGGLRGWLCCAGASLGLFATLGFLNALSFLPRKNLLDRTFS